MRYAVDPQPTENAYQPTREDLDIFMKVVQIMEPLNEEMRRRVWSAVAILAKIDIHRGL